MISIYNIYTQQSISDFSIRVIDFTIKAIDSSIRVTDCTLRMAFCCKHGNATGIDYYKLAMQK